MTNALNMANPTVAEHVKAAHSEALTARAALGQVVSSLQSLAIGKLDGATEQDVQWLIDEALTSLDSTVLSSIRTHLLAAKGQR